MSRHRTIVNPLTWRVWSIAENSRNWDDRIFDHLKSRVLTVWISLDSAGTLDFLLAITAVSRIISKIVDFESVIEKRERMIEPLKIEDIPQIVDLWEEISLNEFSDYIGAKNVECFIESGELEKECKRHLDKTYVFKTNKLVVGFIVVLENLIELLIIKKEFQKQGVGKQLYNYAIGLIKENYSRVKVECFENNLRVNSILKKSGFRFESKYKDEMGFITNTYSKKVEDKSQT